MTSLADDPSDDQIAAWTHTSAFRTCRETVSAVSTALKHAKHITGTDHVDAEQDVMVVHCHRPGRAARVAFVWSSGARVRIVTVLTPEEASSGGANLAPIFPDATPVTFTPLLPDGPVRLRDWQAIVRTEPVWIRGGGCLSGLMLLPLLIAGHVLLHWPWWGIMLGLVVLADTVADATTTAMRTLWQWTLDRRFRSHPHERPEVRLRRWSAPPRERDTQHTQLEHAVRRWNHQNTRPEAPGHDPSTAAHRRFP